VNYRTNIFHACALHLGGNAGRVHGDSLKKPFRTFGIKVMCEHEEEMHTDVIEKVLFSQILAIEI
jgi:hypothetical protein